MQRLRAFNKSVLIKFIIWLVGRTDQIVTDTHIQQRETRSHFSVGKPDPDLRCVHILLAEAT